jgi:hypothetical protein
MKNLNITTRKWIWNTWDKYRPEWFVNILWNDNPTSPIITGLHTSKLRNLLLCEVTGVSRSGDLPDFPDRMGITTFQERTVNQKGKVTFHTHLHFYNCSRRESAGGEMISDPSPIWKSPEEVHFLIRYKVGLRIQKLLKTTTKGNEGVVVKVWNDTLHRAYNLKEMETQNKIFIPRFNQDSDMLLDVENSDLLPLPLINRPSKPIKTNLQIEHKPIKRFYDNTIKV